MEVPLAPLPLMEMVLFVCVLTVTCCNANTPLTKLAVVVGAIVPDASEIVAVPLKLVTVLP